MTIKGEPNGEKRMQRGDGLESDKLGKFVTQENYAVLREVNPTLPANCENCFADLMDKIKVYVVEQDEQKVAFCPECATMDKVRSIL